MKLSQKSKTDYKYSIPEHGQNFVDAFDFPEYKFEEDDLAYSAELAAADYHSHHDGWDAGWPLKIELFSSDGKSLGVFEVEWVVVPEFKGIRIK